MNELHCPGCKEKFWFELSLDRDGYYHIICPLCGHTHMRIVVDGKFSVPRYHPHMEQYSPVVIYGVIR